jgi:spore coat protein JB
LEENTIRPGSSAPPELPENVGRTENMTKSAGELDISGDTKTGGYKMGDLPPSAPLAAGFVPVQRENPPKYDPADGLTRGTLFPGLDLPFMNVANKGNPYAGTPLGELMSLAFATHELGLYLDTHSGDREAFRLLKTLLALEKEGRERYTRTYGPINTRDLAGQDSYNWQHGPWPWEFAERMGS